MVLDQIHTERARSFGDVYLGWMLWRALRLDELFDRLLPAGHWDVPWPKIAAVQVLSRLCSPSSDVHTSTYSEGSCPRNAMTKRGCSRDPLPYCRPVSIARIVTREGVSLSYEVFDGNRAEVTKVGEIVDAVEARLGSANRVWVMDRGMGSEDNLEWLREGDPQYPVGANTAEMRRFEAQLAEERDWRKIRDGVEVKLCPSPDGDETSILCRSSTRGRRTVRSSSASRRARGSRRVTRATPGESAPASESR
jgi:hypothetical protein